MFLPRNWAGNARQVDGEVAVRLVVLDHEDAGEDAFRVETDQDLDRAVVAALERLELGGPERVPCNRLSLV